MKIYLMQDKTNTGTFEVIAELESDAVPARTTKIQFWGQIYYVIDVIHDFRKRSEEQDMTVDGVVHAVQVLVTEQHGGRSLTSS